MRAQIELALVRGTPLRIIAKRFNISHWSVHRHGRNHLSPQLRAAILAAQKPSEVDLEALQRSEAEGILSQLVAQRARLQMTSELALEVGNISDTVKIERAITSNLELVAKLLGQLVSRSETTHTSVLLSTDYLALRGELLRVLQAHPAAAREVAAVLHGLETKAATTIRERAANGKPILIEHDDAEVLQ